MAERKEGYRSYNYHHRVWCEILGDHCRMIGNALVSSEKKYLESTMNCRQLADNALKAAQANELSAKNAQDLLMKVVSLKKSLLADMLRNKVSINMTPVFISHMLNEAGRYETLINAELAGKEVPRFHVLEEHRLWILDAKGHADSLKQQLDGTEMLDLKELKLIRDKFGHLYDAAQGYTRSGVYDFPAITTLTNQCRNEMIIFTDMLKELLELKKSGMELAMIDPLIFDHMLRESAYYLEGIADSMGEVPEENVYDPTSKRIESPAVLKEKQLSPKRV